MGILDWLRRSEEPARTCSSPILYGFCVATQNREPPSRDDVVRALWVIVHNPPSARSGSDLDRIVNHVRSFFHEGGTGIRFVPECGWVERSFPGCSREDLRPLLTRETAKVFAELLSPSQYKEARYLPISVIIDDVAWEFVFCTKPQ